MSCIRPFEESLAHVGFVSQGSKGSRPFASFSSSTRSRHDGGGPHSYVFAFNQSRHDWNPLLLIGIEGCAEWRQLYSPSVGSSRVSS